MASLALVGSFAAGCGTTAGTPPGEDPPPPSALMLADGIILAGGFDALVDRPPEFGFEEAGTVPPAEALDRWGDDGERGARLVSREGAPDADAPLREVLLHHAELLGSMASLEESPPSSIYEIRILETFPSWAQLLVVADGEILLPPEVVRAAIRGGADLPDDPPPDWLHPLGDATARGWVIRAYRGDAASALFGTRSWFGVVELTSRGTAS